MKQKWLMLVMLGVVALVNVGGFLFWKQRKVTAAPTTAVVDSPTVAPRPETEEVERYRNARARRATGVAALEAGDYDKALINFTEAQALIGENAKVAELLKITEDLRNRARAPAEPANGAKAAVPVEQPVAQVVRPTPRPAPAPRVVAAPRPAPKPEEPVETPAPAPAPAPKSTNGMLLVSTTPRGLLVEVDGAALDLTPMRTPLKTGSHQVVLRDGDRRVFETSVDIYEGQVATVLKDLTAEVAAAKAPAPAPTATPAPEPTRTATPEPSATPKPGETPAPRPSAKGSLQITSPGLYGEIWVNGRPQGFPPLTVNDLAAGDVRVEVRVNGVVKRSSVFKVEAGQVTPVRVVK